MELDRNKGFSWTQIAWDEYISWQTQDKRTLKKINSLIKDILRNGLEDGEGKPERLKYMSKMWSRRIDKYNRLVYTVIEGQLQIISCKGHYED